MNWSIVLDFLPRFRDGIVLTIALSVCVIAVAIVLGALLAVIGWSAGRGVRLLIGAFSWLMRCVPALLLLYVAYYGLAQYGIRIDAFPAAVLAIGLQGAAYMYEFFTAGISGVPSGQLDAVKALGTRPPRAWTQIIGPQALRIALPAVGSDAVKLVKGTSLASIITVSELTAASNYAIGITYQAIQVLTPVAAAYAVLTTVVVLLQHAAERALDPGQRRPRRRVAGPAPRLTNAPTARLERTSE